MDMPSLLEFSDLVAKVEVLDVGDPQHDTWSGQPAANSGLAGESYRQYQVVDFEVLELLGPNGDFDPLDEAPLRVLAPAWVAPRISRDTERPSDLGSANFEVGEIGYIVVSTRLDSEVSYPYQQRLLDLAAEQAELAARRVLAGMVEEWWELRDDGVTSALFGFDFARESALRTTFAEVMAGGMWDPFEWQALVSEQDAVARAAELYPGGHPGTPIARLVRRWDAVAWRAEATPDPAVDDLARLALGAWIVGYLGGGLTECDLASLRAAEGGRQQPCDDARGLEGIYFVLNYLNGVPISMGELTRAQAAALEAMPSRAMVAATEMPQPSAEATLAASTATAPSGPPSIPYP